MNPTNNILKLLERLGYLIPTDPESVAIFEEKYKEEIKNAKPADYDNPLEVLKRGVIEKIKLDIGDNTIGYGLAAREGKHIDSEVKRKMLEDRKNAKRKK